VTILYRRGPDEMPADTDEVKEAIIEGIKIEFLTAPKRIIESGGKVKALECVRTELREAPDSGRPRPVVITGSEFTINADTIISAIGQQPDHILKKTFTIDGENTSTNMDGVFAAGDFVNGPTTVVEAMASGKKAARAVDMYLSGKGNSPNG
jgi:NADPH-dependent glutamate synthase beta subunit-like oxidoreductase